MSKLEDEFAMQLAGGGMKYLREMPWAAHYGRKWRADFMVARIEPHRSDPAQKWAVLVEIQGTGPQGRHGSYGHHHSDCEKFSTAAALGWRVLPLSAKMVKDGTGLALVEAALGLKTVPVYVRKPRRSKVPRVKRKAGLPERVRKAAGL